MSTKLQNASHSQSITSNHNSFNKEDKLSVSTKDSSKTLALFKSGTETKVADEFTTDNLLEDIPEENIHKPQLSLHQVSTVLKQVISIDKKLSFPGAMKLISQLEKAAKEHEQSTVTTEYLKNLITTSAKNGKDFHILSKNINNISPNNLPDNYEIDSKTLLNSAQELKKTLLENKGIKTFKEKDGIIIYDSKDKAEQREDYKNYNGRLLNSAQKQIVCRHMSFTKLVEDFKAFQHKSNNPTTAQKPSRSYQQVFNSIENMKKNEDLMANIWDTNHIEHKADEYWLATSINFGDTIKTITDNLKPGDKKFGVIASGIHAMEITLEKKSDSDAIVLTFYDPNRSTAHKRCVVYNPDDVNKLELKDLLYKDDHLDIYNLNQGCSIRFYNNPLEDFAQKTSISNPIWQTAKMENKATAEEKESLILSAIYNNAFSIVNLDKVEDFQTAVTLVTQLHAVKKTEQQIMQKILKKYIELAESTERNLANKILASNKILEYTQNKEFNKFKADKKINEITNLKQIDNIIELLTRTIKPKYIIPMQSVVTLCNKILESKLDDIAKIETTISALPSFLLSINQLHSPINTEDIKNIFANLTEKILNLNASDPALNASDTVVLKYFEQIGQYIPKITDHLYISGDEERSLASQAFEQEIQYSMSMVFENIKKSQHNITSK